MQNAELAKQLEKAAIACIDDLGYTMSWTRLCEDDSMIYFDVADGDEACVVGFDTESAERIGPGEWIDGHGKRASLYRLVPVE